MKTQLLSFVLAAGLALQSATALAQAAAPAAGTTAPEAAPTTAPTAAPTSKAPTQHQFQDWVSRCFPIQSAVSCDVYQAVVNNKTKNRILSISIAFVPSQNTYIAQFIVPLGISIAKGATLITDTYRSPKMIYRRCGREGCFIEGKMDSGLIRTLQGSSQAAIEVTAYRGKPTTIPISLKGFSAAMNDMHASAAARGAKP